MSRENPAPVPLCGPLGRRPPGRPYSFTPAAGESISLLSPPDALFE